ncbi:MAG: hypothetical protein N3G80_02765 [Candidatus Micrarchaeota archaeon]|nr:hypothetical protein [Candidatus Micrarchaeota archaeon]
MKIALFLVFLIVLQNATIQDIIQAERGKYEAKLGKGTEWYGLAILAIGLCLFFNILLYMIGTFLQAENIKRYAKAEFFQLFASSLMIFFAVALLFELSSGGAFGVMERLLGSGGSVACNAVPGGRYYFWNMQAYGGGPIGAFKCKTQEKIDALDRQYDNIFKANKAQEALTSTCISIFGFPIWCWSWDLSYHKKVEEAHLLCSKITGLLISLHAQYALAEYVQRNMLSVFLPLGLLLRIIPLTRGVGGLFIAIAIGFYFVWPTFFVLTDPTFVKVDDKKFDDKLAGMCFSGFKGVAVIVNTALNIGGGMDASALANAQGRQLLYEITIGSMFYPFVALAITLIFIRSATPLLGGELGEFMRMVARLS